jgi:hypothetical protein
MRTDNARPQRSVSAFLRSYRDYYRNQRSGRIQLVSVGFLVVAGVLRRPGTTIVIVALTVLVALPFAYGLWRLKDRV